MALPVKTLVLYKHGVGFIERRGSVEGTQARLTFKKGEMDDILKSLTAEDHGGGKVTGVSYETAEDLSQVLAQKALQVPDREALLGLLRMLKGVRVRLKSHSATTEGTVVGTDETEASLNGDREPLEVRPKVVLKTSGSDLTVVPLREVTGVEILDPATREDLEFYLTASQGERKRETKAVTIFLEGAKHDLSVSYITQVPSWRVSYRLDHSKKRTQVQAWGIIDNQLDEDLKDVRLSLVAGKPISFVYDIYTPRATHRPVVREEVRTLTAPVELEQAQEELAAMALDDALMPEGLAEPDSESSMSDMRTMEKRGAGRRSRADAAGYAAAPSAATRMAAPPPPLPEPSLDSARVTAKAVELGEFFRYDIEAPVTVLRGQSAMVPILQAPIACARQHVYNGAKVARNPVVTLKLKNDTGAILERGPVVVLEDGVYVGEAIIPYTTMESETHIAYAVDLGVVVTEEHTHERHLIGISVKDRYLHLKQKDSRVAKYVVENKKGDPVEIVIEHRRDAGWDLLDTPDPTEKTEGQLRWAFAVKPKTRMEFPVKEEHTSFEYLGVQSISGDWVDAYLKSGLLAKGLAERLRGILALQLERAGIDKRKQDREKDRRLIFEEQERIRSNLKSLSDGTAEKGLRNRYIDKLNKQEEDLERLVTAVEELEKEAKVLDKRIAGAIDHLGE